MHAAFVSAVDELERAFVLGESVADAASGNSGPRDARIVRLAYELAEGASSFVKSQRDDYSLAEPLRDVADEALDLVDLAGLACSTKRAGGVVSAPTEAVERWRRIDALVAVLEVRTGRRHDLSEAEAIERCREVIPEFRRGREAPAFTLIQGGRDAS